MTLSEMVLFQLLKLFGITSKFNQLSFIFLCTAESYNSRNILSLLCLVGMNHTSRRKMRIFHFIILCLFTFTDGDSYWMSIRNTKRNLYRGTRNLQKLNIKHSKPSMRRLNVLSTCTILGSPHKTERHQNESHTTKVQLYRK